MQALKSGHAYEILRKATAPVGSPLPLPRGLVVVAHPDDESLAIGARLSRYSSACFVHVTDGAPKNGYDASAHGFASIEAYRETRQHELLHAFRTGGVSEPDLRPLRFSDQEAGFHLSEITHGLCQLLLEFEPEFVLTHPFEGGHPDHDACAFAVHHAIAINSLEGAPRPVIIEAAFYHQGSSGMETGVFLQRENCDPADEELTCILTSEESDRKRAVLACFATQQETLGQFSLKEERFRIAPEYDFTARTDDRPSLYDRFEWGISSGRFRELASAAQAELETQVVACR